jgi:uncharacterized membrane protein (Fun14 family)
MPIVMTGLVMGGGLRLIDQSLIICAPLATGGLFGFGCGYLLKKLLKLALLVLGGIALLLGYLEFSKWISVNWVTVENQTSTMMETAVHKAYVVTSQMGHEIPIGLGVLGFVPGLVLGINIVQARTDRL